MATIEVFFDYICPHCLRGHDNLEALLPQFSGLNVAWVPCESHPRPEEHGRHSDLCARAFYLAADAGADIAAFHRRMYEATLGEARADIENPDALAGAVGGVTDASALAAALRGDAYADRVLANNRLVWGELDCPAVPSYRMGGDMLKSVPGVGVSREQLEAFIRAHQ